MSDGNWGETFVEKKVNYIVEVEGELIVIENVPARVSTETGEQLFSPKTVERLQELISHRKKPTRIIQTAVY